MNLRVKELWKKILGIKILSFTDHDKNYTVFYGENGWECSCEDFKYRHGSHTFEVEDNNGIFFRNKKHWKEIRTCKHIGQVLADSGIEVWETHGWSRTKIEPQKS